MNYVSYINEECYTQILSILKQVSERIHMRTAALDDIFGEFSNQNMNQFLLLISKLYVTVLLDVINGNGP